MNIEIIEHVNLDEYVYEKDVEKFARVYLDDGTPTKYAISDKGNCYSEYKGGFLKPCLNGHGYIQFHLWCPGLGRKPSQAHRLVAEIFCKQDDPAKWQVDHKNAIKTDNRACNLHWVTPSENTKRSYTEFPHLLPRVYKIFAYPATGGTVQYFDSITDASIELRISASHISQVCTHQRNCCGGFVFGRAEEFDKEKLDAMLASARFQNTGRVVIHILQDGIINEYSSEKDACRKAGIKQATLNGWLSGRRKPKDGSIWKYADGPFVPKKIRY